MTRRQRGDGKATQEFQDKVLRAMPLPPAWVTGRQLYERMDVGGLEYVKNGLRQLVADGKVVKFGPLVAPAYRRIDLPEFKPDKETLILIRRYQQDLAEWKGR